MRDVIVAGVGMTKFTKPGQNEPYRVMGAEAIKLALKDAGIEAAQIEEAYGGYIYGETCSAQHVFYDVCQSGIPVVNVNNACASGSTALYLARRAIMSGTAECVMAFGFEQMQSGELGFAYTDREHAIDRQIAALNRMLFEPGISTLRLFGAAGQEYMDKYQASPELFAKIAVKTRNHAVNNPMSLFSTPLTIEEVMDSKIVYSDYVRRLMCCPPTCGAGAAIICSREFAERHRINARVRIVGQEMCTDNESTWDSAMNVVGADMTRRASSALYEATGVGPDDVDVIELHDCFTINEAITYERLGLCPEGDATRFVDDGDNTYGGKVVINPSGGLMSKGHPIGATGLAQCYELVNQLRNNSGVRQVEGATTALQHNLGVGGAVVVTLYQRA